MKTVRSISGVLVILTRTASLGYFLSFVLSCLAFSTGWSLKITNDATRFEVLYPFTNSPYLLGEYNRGYIIAFLVLLGLYSLFFFLISNVFKAFTKSRIFTVYGIRQLKWFYGTNIILPAVTALILSGFYPIDSIVEILVIIHALLGVFTYFMAAIFEQGVKLQNEQDLII